MPLQRTSIPYIDNLHPHYYLCSYHPLSTGKDSRSYSLLQFKRGRQPYLNNWIDSSLEMLTDASGPATPPIIPPGCIILRALHHDETFVCEDSPTSLDKLGKALAGHFQGHFLPGLLKKSLPTQPVKGLSREERMSLLEGLYSVVDVSISVIPDNPDGSHILSDPESPNIHFLIIDDVLTTGITMKAIISALRRAYPNACPAIFTLAKAAPNPPPNPQPDPPHLP